MDNSTKINEKVFTSEPNESNLSNENKSNSKRQVRKERFERRERVPLAEQNRLLDIKQDPDYSYRLVNDTPGRIEAFRKAGWEIIDRAGNDIELTSARIQDPSWRQSALSQHVGGGLTAFYMRIPNKWYTEDQVNKLKNIDKFEKSLTRKKLVDPEGKEVPQKNIYGEITIDHS